MSRKSVEQRFWEKVDKTAGPDGCWPWTAYRNPSGHGRFWRDRLRVAHCVAYELVTGEPIGPGVQVDHICHNPTCCNPRHLRLATDKQTAAPPGEAGGGEGDSDLITCLGITGNGDLIEGLGLGRRPDDEADIQGLSKGHTTSPAEPATDQGADVHRGSGASTTPEVTQPISRADAESLDKRLRAQVTELAHSFDRVVEVMTKARTGQVHLTLGFASWPAYVADVMKVWGRVPDAIRSSVVAFLDGEGMSQRAIAEATGLSQPTVHRELVKGQNDPDPDAGDSHESPVPEPKPEPVSPPITGRDGKTYKRRPPKPKPEPKPESVADPEAEPESEPKPKPEEAAAPEPESTPQPPPGGLTEDSPGQTDRVRQALENAKATTTEPEPDDSDSPPKAISESESELVQKTNRKREQEAVVRILDLMREVHEGVLKWNREGHSRSTTTDEFTLECLDEIDALAIGVRFAAMKAPSA